LFQDLLLIILFIVVYSNSCVDSKNKENVMEQGLIGLVFCYCQQRIAPLQETHLKETEKLNVLGQVGIV
jgi:hypothetical protein